MSAPPINPEPDTRPVPGAAAYRAFHAGLPLEGEPANALLALPDDLILWLAAVIRHEPVVPPSMPAGDWQKFLALLPPHGIIPLLAWNLRSMQKECRPPEEIMASLSRTLLAAGARSIRLGWQIQQIVQALEDAKIPVMLIKGPALARTVYPDPALRHSSDIDLLVKPEDVLRCEPVFAQLGYTCYEHTFRFAQYGRHHQVFYPEGDGRHVELHWVTDSGYRMFRPEWLDHAFHRRIRIESSDLSFDTLHPVDHLTFLCFHHIFQHQSLRLDWICDIALILQHLTVEDWEELRSTCAANHIRIPLERALGAADLWLPGAVPACARDFPAWPGASAREEHLWGYALHRKTSIHSSFFLAFQGQLSLSEKLMFCVRYVVPPRELMYPYRRSESAIDLPLAYLRRWLLARNYSL